MWSLKKEDAGSGCPGVEYKAEGEKIDGLRMSSKSRVRSLVKKSFR